MHLPPRQGTALHLSINVLSPLHGTPPLLGGGLLHCLVQVTLATPQTPLQELGQFQTDQWPCTIIKKILLHQKNEKAYTCAN